MAKYLGVEVVGREHMSWIFFFDGCVPLLHEISTKRFPQVYFEISKFYMRERLISFKHASEVSIYKGFLGYPAMEQSPFESFTESD